MSKLRKKVVDKVVQRVNAKQDAKPLEKGNPKHQEDFNWLLKSAVQSRNNSG